MYGNYTVQPTQQTSDTRYVEKSILRIRNAREFFYFDVINYTYERVNQWVEVNTGAAQGGTPVQLVIDVPMAAYHNEYNLYNSNVHTPDILKFDNGLCYVNRNRRKFLLTFSGDHKSAVDGNLETFKYNILKSLVSTLSESAIRI